MNLFCHKVNIKSQCVICLHTREYLKVYDDSDWSTDIIDCCLSHRQIFTLPEMMKMNNPEPLSFKAYNIQFFHEVSNQTMTTKPLGNILCELS